MVMPHVLRQNQDFGKRRLTSRAREEVGLAAKRLGEPAPSRSRLIRRLVGYHKLGRHPTLEDQPELLPVYRLVLGHQRITFGTQLITTLLKVEKTRLGYSGILLMKSIGQPHNIDPTINVFLELAFESS